MTAERAVAGVVVCIVGLTLATGPLGPLDIGTGNNSPNLGSGTATVEVVSEPGVVELVPSDDGQNLLHLSAPTTTVRVSNVTGNPALSYRIRFADTGRSTEALQFLAETGEGNLGLTIDRRSYQPRAVENATEAQLSVTLRGENQTTVFERTVPVERP
jgi:hypothetical protein